MYIIWGMIRSTILYCVLLSLISGTGSLLPVIALYALASVLQILRCKGLLKDTRSVAKIFSGALVHDIIAPFLSAESLLERLIKRYILRRPPEEAPIFEVEMQVYVKGVWAICILLILLSKLI